jgi:hypothetical protein
MAKYTWQYYKINEDILSEHKINPVGKKMQNYKNKSTQHVWQMDRDRLLRLIMTYKPCGKQSQGQPLKRLLDC